MRPVVWQWSIASLLDDGGPRQMAQRPFCLAASALYSPAVMWWRSLSLVLRRLQSAQYQASCPRPVGSPQSTHLPSVGGLRRRASIRAALCLAACLSSIFRRTPGCVARYFFTARTLFARFLAREQAAQ